MLLGSNNRDAGHANNQSLPSIKLRCRNAMQGTPRLIGLLPAPRVFAEEAPTAAEKHGARVVDVAAAGAGRDPTLLHRRVHPPRGAVLVGLPGGLAQARRRRGRPRLDRARLDVGGPERGSD